MRKCPCCGRFADLVSKSIVRRGIEICDPCEDRELNYQAPEKWSIDDSEVSKELREFFRLTNDYYDAIECSDDKSEVEKLKRNYEKLKAKRVEKFVVSVEAEDGSSPIAEFVDENLAKARVLGWLGPNSELNGNNSWVSMYGAVISIEEM
jgi:hypothetical protein